MARPSSSRSACAGGRGFPRARQARARRSRLTGPIRSRSCDHAARAAPIPRPTGGDRALRRSRPSRAAAAAGIRTSRPRSGAISIAAAVLVLGAGGGAGAGLAGGGERLGRPRPAAPRSRAAPPRRRARAPAAAWAASAASTDFARSAPRSGRSSSSGASASRCASASASAIRRPNSSWRLSASAARGAPVGLLLRAPLRRAGWSALTARAWVAASARTSASACWARFGGRAQLGDLRLGRRGDRAESATTRFGLVDALACASARSGLGLVGALGEAGAAKLEPLHLDVALSSARPASRIAAAGLGLGPAGGVGGLAGGLPSRRSAASMRGLGLARPRRRRREAPLDLGEPVDPDQPLGGGGAEAGGDEAVPAAQPAVAGDQPLADGERDAPSSLSATPICASRRARRGGRLDMVGERLAAGRERRIAGAAARRRSSAAARRLRAPRRDRRRARRRARARSRARP